MLSFKNKLKHIPLVGDMLVQIKKLVAEKPSPIKGNNNRINNKGTFKNVTYDIVGNNNEVRIGENTFISDTLIFIRGDHHRIIVEDNCVVSGGEWWIEDDHCSLILHSYTTIEHAHLAITEPFSILEIHRDCMLAKQVEIRTGDSHSIIDNETGLRINKAANVVLKEHVWVGAHVKILKGVTIEAHSVIATASVVTNDIPSFSIAAGIPAKVIRTNIDWKRERIYD